MSNPASPINKIRASRISRIISETYREDGDAGIVDLITDIRHFCRQESCNFDNLLRISENHFECEISDFLKT